jgi:hypothetical protein
MQPQSKVVGKHVDRNCRSEHHDADPKQRGVMNAPPIATAAGRPSRARVMFSLQVRPPLFVIPVSRSGNDRQGYRGVLRGRRSGLFRNLILEQNRTRWRGQDPPVAGGHAGRAGCECSAAVLTGSAIVLRFGSTMSDGRASSVVLPDRLPAAFKSSKHLQGLDWCCERGLNSRPLHYQWSALPLSYRSIRSRPVFPRGPA